MPPEPIGQDVTAQSRERCYILPVVTNVQSHLRANDAPPQVVPKLLSISDGVERVVVVQTAGAVVAQLFQARHVNVTLRQDEEVDADLRGSETASGYEPRNSAFCRLSTGRANACCCVANLCCDHQRPHGPDALKFCLERRLQK